VAASALRYARVVSDLPTPPGTAALPLRTRKRLEAMRRIQRVAVDRFDRDGFDHVTIEEVAAASEVSARSVYRYFGTKEQLVIWEPHDVTAGPLVLADDNGGSPIDAVGALMLSSLVAGMTEDLDLVRRRMRLVFTTPSIEAALAVQAYSLAPGIAERIAPILGRPSDDPDVQVHAHAFVGGMVGSLRSWFAGGFTDTPEVVVARPLAVLARGLQAAPADRD
jgi:AcrR family transcriptional regulator